MRWGDGEIWWHFRAIRSEGKSGAAEMICSLLPSHQAMGVRGVVAIRRGPIRTNKSTNDARCYRFLKYCLFIELIELIELNEWKNLDFNQTFIPRTVQFRTRWGRLESCALIWSADLQIHDRFLSHFLTQKRKYVVLLLSQGWTAAVRPHK